MDLQEVLNYELSSVPLSLAYPNGTLCKTVKAKLVTILDSSIPQVVAVPENTPKIFDGMVLLQKLPPTLTTFGEISDYLLKKITTGTAQVSFFVTDHYLPHSIKSMERERRSNAGTLRIKVMRRTQERPKQFVKFLRNSDNKLDLIKFLLNDWLNNIQHFNTLKDKEVYMTCENKAFHITSSRGLILSRHEPELTSIQEEAHTKMFLCAFFASSLGFTTVEIITVDTDVLVLAIYFQEQINVSMYVQIGTAATVRIYDSHSNTIEENVVNALPYLLLKLEGVILLVHSMESASKNVTRSCFQTTDSLMQWLL